MNQTVSIFYKDIGAKVSILPFIPFSSVCSRSFTSHVFFYHHNALQFLTLAIETIEYMFYQEKKPEIVSGPTSYHFFSPINRHICHRECKYSASPHTRRCPSQT